jgi:hypothetical protein
VGFEMTRSVRSAVFLVATSSPVNRVPIHISHKYVCPYENVNLPLEFANVVIVVPVSVDSTNLLRSLMQSALQHKRCKGFVVLVILGCDSY